MTVLLTRTAHRVLLLQEDLSWSELDGEVAKSKGAFLDSPPAAENIADNVACATTVSCCDRFCNTDAVSLPIVSNCEAMLSFR